MKRSGFRKQSIEEVREKQAIKRQKLLDNPKPRKTPQKGKMGVSGGKKKRKTKTKTQAQLKKELDRVFSLYIRNKFSDENGNNNCYTCGKAGTVKTMQCGHFVSRQYLATRWHENNCRIQCAGCNLFGNGKPLDFEENLKKELGNEYVEEMKLTRHQSLKLDRNWYLEQIEKYKSGDN